MEADTEPPCAEKSSIFQQDFNLLDGKLNDLNTDAKSSRVEGFDFVTNIKDVATNAHPDAMRN